MTQYQASLFERLDVQSTVGHSQSVGFCRRGEALAEAAVVTQIPENLQGEESVCGLKAFLIDERRRFALAEGHQEVDCAKVAALDICDSPVHVHGETLETYLILSGRGQMLLGEQVFPVGPGSIILIPPGVPHGLAAEDPHQALRVVMTFTPGLAPIEHPELRDERILAPAASALIRSYSADS